ncbi:hypothetical protein SAMN05444483_102428 [Salegentibacter echinorum]|uniref:Uncharacterized protein n=1 Tax=Salegentibacter echinorum TaxID=1073325 RepID=A0A1M5EM48_SALEC|nr:hypothetical protein [Salegentibacter echinorum]SHF80190.1 hypothetical protein SAMN05444483_102428 [Salegentibacter echinorum]
MKKLVFSFVVLLYSCGEKSASDEMSYSSLDSTTLSQPIPSTREEVNLLPEAREQALEWLAYIAAQNEIDKLKGASLGETIESARPLAQIMESLRNTVPDSLDSKAVHARLSVILTKAKTLEQLAYRRKLDAEKITRTASEIPTEFNNFKIQLNELFLKTLEEFEAELDRFEVERDSIPADSLFVD